MDKARRGNFAKRYSTFRDRSFHVHYQQSGQPNDILDTVLFQLFLKIPVTLFGFFSMPGLEVDDSLVLIFTYSLKKLTRTNLEMLGPKMFDIRQRTHIGLVFRSIEFMGKVSFSYPQVRIRTLSKVPIQQCR